MAKKTKVSELEIPYQLTVDDYLKGYETHWKAHKSGTLSTLILGIILFIFGLILCFMIFVPGLFLLLAGLTITGLILFRKFKHKKAFLNNPDLSFKTSIKLKVDDFEIKYKDKSLNLDDFKKYFESDDFVLLYVEEKNFRIIPKSAFENPNHLKKFLRVVKQYLVRTIH